MACERRVAVRVVAVTLSTGDYHFGWRELDRLVPRLDRLTLADVPRIGVPEVVKDGAEKIESERRSRDVFRVWFYWFWL